MAADETLESLGLEAPPPPPVVAPPPRPPPAPRAEDLVDVVVLAAVERTGSKPSEVRPWLHAVFKRACDLGLTAEAAEKALRPSGGERPATKDKRKARGAG
jgi:hypothetical protein